MRRVRKLEMLEKKRAEDLLGEVENAKDDTQMFKVVKALHMKHQRIQFMYKEQCLSQPQEIQNIIDGIP